MRAKTNTATKYASMTKEEILQAIKQSAAELGHAPSIGELVKRTRISKQCLYRNFGNYRNALALCGLERTGPGYQTDMEGLFRDWAGVARKVGKVPTMGDYEAHGKYSIQPLLRRYGIWGDVPAGMLEFAKKEGLQAEWKDVMEMVGQGWGRKSLLKAVRRSVPRKSQELHAEDGPVYGTPLTLGPLTFAPTDEGGVIFLFGALAADLGFAVSRIQAAFPDCEAMREVRPGKWRPKRVEFELESRNFLKHGHDIKGCDIIVCWINNWEDCPVEVIELRSVLEAMKRKVGG
ncbi:MAG TPA: hypothetical protein VGJ33_16715 [Candidatus Angelobacter sp.]|jgi:hypothetical protein